MRVDKAPARDINGAATPEGSSPAAVTPVPSPLYRPSQAIGHQITRARRRHRRPGCLRPRLPEIRSATRPRGIESRILWALGHQDVGRVRERVSGVLRKALPQCHAREPGWSRTVIAVLAQNPIVSAPPHGRPSSVRPSMSGSPRRSPRTGDFRWRALSGRRLADAVHDRLDHSFDALVVDRPGFALCP